MTPVVGYSQMKDSGAAWLGHIPEEWGVSKIGTLYTQRNDKVSDKDYPPLSVTMKGILPQLATAAKTDDGDNRKMVKVGDFAINSRSDRRGSCGISPYDGSVSLINTVLTPRKAMHPEYYNWLFHTSLFADEFYKWGHGIVDDLWTTRWSEMKRILVPVPPYETQEFIATYLDTQIAKIDEIIAEAKASIEDYKQWKASVIYEAVTKGLTPDVGMKESGVEWIGKIPNKWTVKAVKHIMRESKERTVTGEETMLSVTQKHGIIKSSDATISNPSISTSDWRIVQKGDIVFNKYKAHSGVFFVSPLNGIVTFNYCVYKCSVENCAKYFEYQFKTPRCIDEFITHMKGVGESISPLYTTELYKIKVIVPPLEEQLQIVDFLDNICPKIDVLISEKEVLVSDLESYKKSLIYEVVTGKCRVPTQAETTVVAIHPAYQKALLMCRVLDLLGNDARGRIHVQKCLFAIECLLKMPFQTQYARYQHGPYDTGIADYEALIGENDWFTVQSGSPVTYKKGAHFDAYLTEYMKVFAELDSKIKEIVEYLKPMKTAQAERVATLLAAWNDFILDGTADPTDQQIINEVITNWTPNKANTQVSTWQTTLDKLKNSGFVPAGFGVHTIPKEVQEV